MFPAHTQRGSEWSGCVPHAHPEGLSLRPKLSQPEQTVLGVCPVHSQSGLGVFPARAQRPLPSARPATRSGQRLRSRFLGVSHARAQMLLGVCPAHGQTTLSSVRLLSVLLGVFPVRAQNGLGVLRPRAQPVLLPARLPPVLLGVLVVRAQRPVGVRPVHGHSHLPPATCHLLPAPLHDPGPGSDGG